MISLIEFCLGAFFIWVLLFLVNLRNEIKDLKEIFKEIKENQDKVIDNCEIEMDIREKEDMEFRKAVIEQTEIDDKKMEELKELIIKQNENFELLYMHFFNDKAEGSEAEAEGSEEDSEEEPEEDSEEEEEPEYCEDPDEEPEESEEFPEYREEDFVDDEEEESHSLFRGHFVSVIKWYEHKKESKPDWIDDWLKKNIRRYKKGSLTEGQSKMIKYLEDLKIISL